MMTVIKERTVGEHRIIQEAEDVLVAIFAAAPSEAEMRAIVDAQVELAAGRPIYLILDLSRIGTMSPGARRAVGEASSRLSFKAFVMYGASFPMKVTAKLLSSALSLFQKSAIPQEFVENHEEARAWVVAHRQQLAVGA